MPNCPQPVLQVRKHTCPQSALRIGIKKMGSRKNESALGRFSYLLKGRAKPRRSLALMMALVIVAVLSFAGVVSADNYYNGTVPTTELQGRVNGSVDVKFVDTWKSDNPINNDNTTAEFTGLPTSRVKFAQLFIVPYTASMSENWKGTLTVTLARPGMSNVVLLNAQPLDLAYNNRTGTTCNTTVSLPPFISRDYGLCRVTSDYVAVLNLTDYMTSSSMTLYISTTNVSGRFDGRIKEAKLAYGWDVAPEQSTGYTYYWKNVGQDPITKYIGTYTANQTVFSGVTIPESGNYNANLWVDFVAGNSTSGPGYGKYWWNGQNLTLGQYSPVALTNGTYAGLSKWSWNQGSGITTNDGVNTLAYSRTNDYYKIIVALFTIKGT